MPVNSQVASCRESLSRNDDLSQSNVIQQAVTADLKVEKIADKERYKVQMGLKEPKGGI